MLKDALALLHYWMKECMVEKTQSEVSKGRKREVEHRERNELEDMMN